MYEKQSAPNKVFLLKRLFHINMVEGIIIVEHLNELNTVISQLTSIGINFEDEVRALLMLSSLLESWDGLVMVLRNSSSLGTLKFDDVVSVILSEEVYIKNNKRSIIKCECTECRRSNKSS